jgi:hypothetical protein
MYFFLYKTSESSNNPGLCMCWLLSPPPNSSPRHMYPSPSPGNCDLMDPPILEGLPCYDVAQGGHTSLRIMFGNHGDQKGHPIMSSFSEVNKKVSLNRQDQRELFLVLIFFFLLSYKTNTLKCIKYTSLQCTTPLIFFTNIRPYN